MLTNLRNSHKYLLHQCGTPAVYNDLPSGITVDSSGVPSVPVFTVPVQSWSTGGTIPISFVEEINMLPSAEALDPTYMTSACGQKLIGCAAIRTGAPSNSSVHFTDDWLTGATNTAIDVRFDASSDPGMLHRAEWLKFVSTFFNKEPEANRVFEGIQERYTATQNAASAARLAGTAPALRMAWIVHSEPSPWGAESWRISNDAYKIQATTNAGGLGPDATALGAICPISGTRYVCPSSAVMKQALQMFDAVIDESYHSAGYAGYDLDAFKNRWNLTADDVASGSYPFLVNNRVYRTDKRLSSTGAGSDWFESALPHADIVLTDIVSKLVPSVFVAATVSSSSGFTYCDSVSPTTNPCCGFTSRDAQAACVNYCDTHSPTEEPCCSQTSKCG